MRRVSWSMGVSLDGYIIGPDGSFDFGAPDEEVFRFCIEEIRGMGVHFMGRRLYETMLYWETADQDPSLSEDEREWTALWKALPKVVFSRTLTTVVGNARLASGDVAEEIGRWRAEPGDGGIAVGGADLAHQVAALGLIDDYLVRFHPVLVGGGVPFFDHQEQRVELELVGTRAFASGVVFLHHRVKRQLSPAGD
ncbi:MAG TPA: dihydrofolate reductase family protein [Mycobacteriales bacterium]|nr:dihydrofolate reductase family protein [Mycobacteriales bacterium]